MNAINEIKRTLQNWWVLLIYGILLVVFAIWIWVTPEPAYLGLAIYFSVMVVINGLTDIVFAVSNRKYLEGWGWFLAGGIATLAIGVILLIEPQLSMLSLSIIVGFWIMLRATLIMGTSLDLKKIGIKGWGSLLFLGILVALFAFFMIADPNFGALTIVIWTGIAIAFMGVSYIWTALQLRKVKAATLDQVDAFKDFIKSEAKGFKEGLWKAMEDSMKESDADTAKARADMEKQVDDYLANAEKAEKDAGAGA